MEVGLTGDDARERFCRCTSHWMVAPDRTDRADRIHRLLQAELQLCWVAMGYVGLLALSQDQLDQVSYQHLMVQWSSLRV